MSGEDRLSRVVRDLEKAIEQAISGSPQVEECLARVRAEGHEVSLLLQATLAVAPLGQLDEKAVEELAADPTGRFKMSLHDKKFLRSLKIAVDDDGS